MEVTGAWDLLTREAREASEWLGVETEHVIIAGLGEGSVTAKQGAI